MSADQDFVHLHVHTEFSLLDGLSKIDKLTARAAELGMKHLAITDHGAMFGVVHFWRACQKVGIKPIIGMEGYLAKSSMHTHDQSERQPFHLLLLAKDQTGYKNLLKIASAAQLEGFYSKPRIDKDFLAAHAEGLICTSGCLAAEIPRMITDGREEEARRTIGWYQDAFGPENFFLELQDHDIPEIKVLNKWLVENQAYANVPLLATNDVHYVLNEDFNAHDTLLCIQTGALKSEAKRMRMTDPSYHLRTQKEMWQIFGEVPSSLSNTVLVAEMCDVNLDSKGYHLPVFPVPEGYSADTYLRALAERGLHWRYGDNVPEATVNRLNYELGVIHQMGFDTYFLIVWDLCQYARHADIWWNVRGSGAGSVVAYCLGITNIDPISNNLIFERFLNPGRVSMPDIDMDFPDNRRMDMIDYAMRKYGSEKVAAIITFGTMKARAAIKDVGRVLDYPLPQVNELTKLVPQIPSKPVTLADCLGDNPEKAVPELRKLYDEDPGIRTLLDTALTVEGVARNAGTHAAGVIIGDKPLVEYLPLHRPIGDSKVIQVTQFPMEICESIGLLKVDFLGLSTLTIMRKACELIEKYHGIRFNMSNIPYRPDPNNIEITDKVTKLFDLIGQGETTGVFQLESEGMTRMLKEMKPQTFENIIAAISLYRPGPMELIPSYIKRMHGKEDVTYHHPLLEPILRETYGICVYQEQIQQIAAQLFGYSLGDADLMRRAVSKKKAKDLAIHKQTFMEKGPERGITPEIAEKIFAEIEFFAAYGFNKSHAADYAVLTCQTAYLKAHFPEEYYTALLSVQRDVIEDVRLFINDCRHFNIAILPPNVNHSDVDFTIERTGKGNQRGIRYGLGAVKNAGEKAVQAIIDARAEGGSFKDISDFGRRVDLRQVGKRAMESLIRIGAFDQLADRDEMLASLERIVKFSTDHHRAVDNGQMSLFGGMDSGTGDDFVLTSVPADKQSSQREKLRWEKDLIGLYVSEHPLNAIEHQLRHLANMHRSETLRRNAEILNGRNVTVAGLIVGIRTITTKKGDAMGIITLEDVEGVLDCVLFPRTWNEFQALVKDDKLVIMRGKADSSRGDIQIIVDHVTQDFDVASAVGDIDEDDPWWSESEYNSTTGVAPEWDTTTTNGNGEPHPEPRTERVADISEENVDEMINEDEDIPVPVYELSSASEQITAVNAVPDTIQQAHSVVASAMASFDYEDNQPIDRHTPPCLITITLVRSDDPDKDRRRFNRVQNKLIQVPGHDQFRFRVVDEAKTVIVDFPNHSTRFQGEVEAFLRGEFGANAIQVEPLPRD